MTTTAASPWQAGAMLEGRYLLTEPAGRGGSATVWHARDERLGRMVAVKLLKTDLLDDEAALHRLQVEAQALARLRHPNLADVYDYGLVHQGRRLSAAYLVMELIDGIALKQVLTEHIRLPWEQAAQVGAQIADGLAAAHARGIVHRDIAPGNVLLPAGGVKIIDFELCAPPGSNEYDADGQLIGTPAYVSPERLDGRLVQPAADVYALGVLLYRMLAGTLPWRADNAVALMTAPLLRPPTPLPAVPGLPPQLAAAVAACLSEQPDRRPSAAELAATLRAHTPEEVPAIVAVPAADDEAVTHILPWRPAGTRRRRRFLTAAAAAAVLAGAGVVWAVATRTEPPQFSAAPPAPQASPAACTAVYRLLSDDAGRYRANLTVTNTTDTPVSGPVAFTVPAGQRIDAAYGWAQRDRTATNDTVGTVEPGRSAVMLVGGAYAGSNPLPTAFTLAGKPCVPTLLSTSGSRLPVPAASGATGPVAPGSGGPVLPGEQTSPAASPQAPTTAPSSQEPPPSPVEPSPSAANPGDGEGQVLASIPPAGP
ncbi:serine/threonine-protein kinase [Catellatospora sp. NPDC049133]|jgi:serine/threonine-protein kinase|uniref:serine/threonine-protein kinase n=1 Tax=Catellatospora sp. NPDC049133 TaxID=3155499 RepID=UPI0033F7013A